MHLHIVDFMVMGLYLIGMLWIGRVFARKEKSTEDYFLGGRRIPWWAASLSIYATGVSAISFVAIPAETFAGDWTNLPFAVLPVFGILLVAFAFIPMLRRLNLTTLMEYYELRFNRTLRGYGTLMSILAQVGGRMSVVMLIPSMALTQVTELNLVTSILIMGGISTVYTVLGGIGAVIWTDVLQVLVIFGGTLICIVLLLNGIEGGVGEVVRVGKLEHKFQTVDWEFSLTSPTIWVFLFWGIRDVFARLGQESLQRTFSTRDEKEARKSFIGYALISLPGQLVFFSIGTLLYVYYQQHPLSLPPDVEKNAIFPLFIAQQVPVGLAGLIFAGLFAAAMSTLDSAMNSVATMVVQDTVAFTSKPGTEKGRLVLARWITVLTGLVGTSVALWLSQIELGSLWNLFETIVSYLTGGMVAVTTLGLLTRRANGPGVIIGVILGTGLPVLLKTYTTLHPFTFGGITVVVCCLVGYLASFCFKSKTVAELKGLTIWKG